MKTLMLNPSRLFDQLYVRSHSVNDLSTQLSTSSSESNGMNRFVNKQAKLKVYEALRAIEHGSLELNDQDDIIVFGQTETTGLNARVTVHDERAYSKFAFEGNVGVAEAYILGYWSTPDLLKACQVLAKNIHVLGGVEQNKQHTKNLMIKLFHFLNRNSLDGSRRNISAHYDLGNDFFSLFLDPTMMYSSAIFNHETHTLEQASLNKLKVICEKLALSADDHLLEIGTGWGGMAVYAAQNYGCKVSTTTISQEQYDYACEKVKQLGLENQITVLKQDYRNLRGRYDKLVSIEMIEAVGHEHYQTYFKQCSELLKEDGLMLIQAITIPDQRYQLSLNSVDFIQKYIFPGGRLPCNQVISEQLAKNTDLQVVDMHDIGLDYAETLRYWREAFHSNMNEVKAQGFDEYFCRMWDYYLCYCQGGFSERAISTVQYLMAKPQASFSSARN